MFSWIQFAMNLKVMIIASFVFVFCRMDGFISAWPDSILENEIQVLTLRQGVMTTGRRSSPIPQLQCVYGGTAGCMRVLPTVVQCYNKGSDGISSQWECKAAESDNSVKFGKIDVACEGYRNRDDPYVLVGSCGLRYTLDYTREAWRF